MQTQEHYAPTLESGGSEARSIGQSPILAAHVLVEAVLFLHLFWCGWVLLGWTVTRRRPLLRTLHVASLIYAIAGLLRRQCLVSMLFLMALCFVMLS